MAYRPQVETPAEPHEPAHEMQLLLMQYEGPEKTVSATVTSSGISTDSRINMSQSRRIARAIFGHRLGRKLPDWLFPDDFADRSKVTTLEAVTIPGDGRMNCHVSGYYYRR